MKRFLRILKRTAIVAGGLIAILLLVAAVWCWRSGARLEKRLEAIRAAGDPMSFAELARDPIPPETNAAVFLRRAEEDLEAVEKELTAVYSSETYGSARLDEAQTKTIQSALEAYPNLIPLLEQAAACPDYDSQADCTVDLHAFIGATMNRVQELRPAARVVRARALLFESQGQLEEAVEDCILTFRLSRHFHREPTLIAYLVAIACQRIGVHATNHVLRAGPVSESAREALEDELALHDGAEAFGWALKSERAVGIESFRAIPGRNWWPIRAMWDKDECAYLDLIDQHLALASQPYVQAAATLNAPVSGRLTEAVRPAILSAREATDCVRAEIRCLRVLNALQALEEEGAVAEPKLSDLGLPDEAVLDPFTGKPLKVKRLSEGWLIYAVGKNLSDDGGQLDKRQDVGVRPQ